MFGMMLPAMLPSMCWRKMILVSHFSFRMKLLNIILVWSKMNRENDV